MFSFSSMNCSIFWLSFRCVAKQYFSEYGFSSLHVPIIIDCFNVRVCSQGSLFLREVDLLVRLLCQENFYWARIALTELYGGFACTSFLFFLLRGCCWTALRRRHTVRFSLNAVFKWVLHYSIKC